MGKSVLLHVLGSRRLAALPPHLTIMHVAQEAEGSSEVTVLEAVMAADLRAKNLQRYGVYGVGV